MLRTGAPFRLKVFSAVRTDLNGRLIIRLPLFLPFLIMVQLPAAFSAKPPPAPGFAALLDRRSAFRAFVDRCVRAVPLRVVVPHPALAAAEFLPRDVAGWNKALPAVQACQLIRHDAFPLVCFFHFTTLGKVHDYLTLTSAWSKEAQKEKETCESGQDLTEEICAVAEAVIPT